jgi:predicted lipid-binding transport protein (Tim44 family)
MAKPLVPVPPQAYLLLSRLQKHAAKSPIWMDTMAIMDILLFAAVAAFLVLRLRSILGKRTGAEDAERWNRRPPERPADLTTERAEQTSDNVTPFPGSARAAQVPAKIVLNDPALQLGLEEIRRADPSFDPAEFVEGARSAFEMILMSYAQGDTATLKPLLAPEVYSGFAGAIQGRQTAKQTLETTLVGIQTADLVGLRMAGRFAEVTVKFVTEQVNVLRDAEGKALEGEAASVTKLTDMWTFARDTRSRDPNWLLIRTEDAA